jgi:hypothetical protein
MRQEAESHCRGPSWSGAVFLGEVVLETRSETLHSVALNSLTSSKVILSLGDVVMRSPFLKVVVASERGGNRVRWSIGSNYAT